MLSGLVEEREGFREVWEEVWSVHALRPVLKMLDHVAFLIPLTEPFRKYGSVKNTLHR